MFVPIATTVDNVITLDIPVDVDTSGNVKDPP